MHIEAAGYRVVVPDMRGYGASPKPDDTGQLEAMRAATAELRMETLLPGAGHWIQQERPEATNRALIAFLRGLGDFS